MERKIKLVFDVTRRLNYYIISILFIVIYMQNINIYIYNNLNTNNYIIDDPLDFSVEDNSYSSSEMMNGSLKIYNANVPSLLDSDEESDSHEEDFIIKPFLLLEEGIKAHNEEKYDNAWECLVAQSEIENLKAKYWKTYCYLYNGINVSKNLDEAIKII
ncbi:uncharacterized protein OCT59_019654 [Rhizophagus irregularis]|uniref:uncharacterized protein n=1 Tax=Rhizophagus irregularis TaxID=588596 RepID=UPI001C1ABCE5|nr:hypothetical protein OCT59_019654 [Rhizophagus irregularis]CAB4483701.1 unnamed protein product [Rhizophagus irregularis]